MVWCACVCSLLRRRYVQSRGATALHGVALAMVNVVPPVYGESSKYNFCMNDVLYTDGVDRMSLIPTA